MSEIIDPPVAADSIQRLKPNAVGLIGVLFMAVATAAPITAMVGNVPIAVVSGNGAYAPAGYFCGYHRAGPCLPPVTPG